MKLRTLSIVVVVIFGALLVSCLRLPDAQADNPHGCSNATLTGSFGFYRTGNTPDGPLAAVGIIVFDGNGNQKGSQSISRNGDYSFGRAFFSQYKVAPDCTFKLLSDGAEFSRGVIVDEGKGFYFLSESGGNAVCGVGTKIHTN